MSLPSSTVWRGSPSHWRRFASGSDQATKGLDNASGWAITLLLLVTAIPALVLAYRRRAPRTALVLALAFPTAFAVLFVAVVIAFA